MDTGSPSPAADGESPLAAERERVVQALCTVSGAGPVVRLSGLAVMGGVETETRLPGETGREAKRRRRRLRSRGRG
jgi:hypothetical protein